MHVHIIPGIDDGPKNLQESAAMARNYVEVGIRSIIATPHFIPGTAWAIHADTVLGKLEELNSYLANLGIPLFVYPGMEIAFHRNLHERIQKRVLLSLAGSDRYLIEPAFLDTQENLLYGIEALLHSGKKVIIAHAERIKSFQQEIQSLRHLVTQGLEIQINMDSLLDDENSPRRNTALRLLAADSVHYLASDAHSAQRRSPPTASAWAVLLQLLGSETLERLCVTNPGRLIAANYH